MSHHSPVTNKKCVLECLYHATFVFAHSRQAVCYSGEEFSVIFLQFTSLCQ